MKMNVKRTHQDFDDWAVKFNGEYVCHETLVSADLVSGEYVSQLIDGDGNVLDEKVTKTGVIRFVERNEAVREHEPKVRSLLTEETDEPLPASVTLEHAPDVPESDKEAESKKTASDGVKVTIKKN